MKELGLNLYNEVEFQSMEKQDDVKGITEAEEADEDEEADAGDDVDESRDEE